MNKREKEVLHLTIKEVAAQATEIIKQRQEEMWSDGKCHSGWEIERVINDVVNTFIPKETLSKMGLNVSARVQTSASFSVGTEVKLNLRLRKGHPLYNSLYGDNALRTEVLLFNIKRKKSDDKTSLVFKHLECLDKSYSKTNTIVDMCDLQTRRMVFRQLSDIDSARTILECRNIIGEEVLKKLFAALHYLNSHFPSYKYIDWTSDVNLVPIAGLTDRVANILKSAEEGKRVMPAGIDAAAKAKLMRPVAIQPPTESRCGICVGCFACPAAGTGVAFPCPHFGDAHIRITEIEALLENDLAPEDEVPELEKELAMLEKMVAVYEMTAGKGDVA